MCREMALSYITASCCWYYCTGIVHVDSVHTVWSIALASAQHASCLFTSEYHNTNFTQTLQFPIEYPIVAEAIAVVVEIISAQSPHTMKG